MKGAAPAGALGLLLGLVPLVLSAAGAAPASDPSGWCAPPRVLRETARDDFSQGGPAPRLWRLEAESPLAQVHGAPAGLLDIRTPAGLSLWWRQPLQGDYAIRFEAQALPAPDSAGALAGRVSDLNLFWNASEADGQAPRPRDGRFASLDNLSAYYLGYGANGNRSTRVRAYDGQGGRPVLAGWADAPEAGSDDRHGPLGPATRLQPGQWLTVAVVSHTPRPGSTVHGQVAVAGHVLHTFTQPQPLLRGWFALRTTASRLQVRGFHILHCQTP